MLNFYYIDFKNKKLKVNFSEVYMRVITVITF